MAEVVKSEAPLQVGDDFIARIWSPQFPSADMLETAAALVPAARQAAGPGSELTEGPRWEFTIAPGMVSIRSRDYAKAERTYERQVQARRKSVDERVRWQGDLPEPVPQRTITGWSRKSRANMVQRLCQFDYEKLFPSGRLPAMITLTYSDKWQVVAPRGADAKEHLQAFRKRWRRAWGEDCAAVWKLEFQQRGAPHFHLLVCPPHGRSLTTGERFSEWLSRTWADVVGHPDPEEYAKHLRAGTGIDWNDGLRSTDPKRVAVYFTKHGAFKAKEYQHCVPSEWQKPGCGPGRFWGNWVLKPVRSVVTVTSENAIHAARTMRRWARAQGTTRQVTKMRVEQATGRVRYRNSRVRVNRIAHGRGFISVNDGANFGADIARYLTLRSAFS